MLRTLYLVLSAADEADLSRQVAARSDTVAFVDGVLWPDEIPPLVPTIEAATSNRVLLWDRQVFPRLPFVRTAHGEIHGPSTRYVICLDRSAPTRFGGLEVLVFGMLTWSTTDPDQSGRDFHSWVWRAARKVTPHKIHVPGYPAAPGFRAGIGAVAWWKEHPETRRFGLNAVGVQAVPVV